MYEMLIRVLEKTHNIVWSRDYKTFVMLNSAEHEILNAHKHENIKNSASDGQAQMILEYYFSCL